ncbi:MAG: YwaF family protein [Defluviitaleaceae bacterium]|nr:YwaF family protein [Defluviitaleaceae bacterium]
MFFEAGAFYFVYLAVFGGIVGILVATLISKMKDKSYEEKLKPIRFFFVVLVILEITKIYALITINEALHPLRYPIVFCSIILYAWPLFSFKHNRFSEAAKSLAVLPSMAAGLVFLVMPGNIAPAQLYATGSNLSGFFVYALAAHSFFFHILMIGMGVYILAVRIYTIQKNNYYSAFLAMSSYLAIATVISLYIRNNISIFGPQSGQLGFLYNEVGYIPGQLLLIALLFAIYFAIHKLAGKNTETRA